jgi:hypothetical protein
MQESGKDMITPVQEAIERALSNVERRLRRAMEEIVRGFSQGVDEDEHGEEELPFDVDEAIETLGKFEALQRLAALARERGEGWRRDLAMEARHTHGHVKAATVEREALIEQMGLTEFQRFEVAADFLFEQYADSLKFWTPTKHGIL